MQDTNSPYDSFAITEHEQRFAPQSLPAGLTFDQFHVGISEVAPNGAWEIIDETTWYWLDKQTERPTDDAIIAAWKTWDAKHVKPTRTITLGLTRVQFERALALLDGRFAYRFDVDGVHYEWRGLDTGDTYEMVDPPTDADITAAWQACILDDQKREAARQVIVNAANSAEGVNISALTAAQRNALLVVVLHKFGAIDANGNVLPLSQWS